MQTISELNEKLEMHNREKHFQFSNIQTLNEENANLKVQIIDLLKNKDELESELKQFKLNQSNVNGNDDTNSKKYSNDVKTLECTSDHDFHDCLSELDNNDDPSNVVAFSSKSDVIEEMQSDDTFFTVIECTNSDNISYEISKIISKEDVVEFAQCIKNRIKMFENQPSSNKTTGGFVKKIKVIFEK